MDHAGEAAVRGRWLLQMPLVRTPMLFESMLRVDQRPLLLRVPLRGGDDLMASQNENDCVPGQCQPPHLSQCGLLGCIFKCAFGHVYSWDSLGTCLAFSVSFRGNEVQKEGRMSYADFVWLLISEEDKRSPTRSGWFCYPSSGV